VAKISRHQLAKAEEMDSLEKLKRRSKKQSVKIAKGTEQLLEDMVEQNKELSRQKLLLSRLYRVAYRLLPQPAKDEIDRLASQLDIVDVHPE